MAATVDEDVASGTIGSGSAEALRSVTLLQGAFILLHGQTVIGEAQLLMGRFGVQFERLT